MKILWHSVAPWCTTGYGQQTATFAPRIRDLGHDVTLSAWFGLNDSALEYEGMVVLPGDQKYGNIVLPDYARDVNADLVIALMDAWVLEADRMRDLPLAVWVPVDHHPCPPAVAQFFHLTGATPIAMSRHGEQALRDQGLNPLYVPHGINANVFRPGNRDQLRDARQVGDRFLVGVVANNAGGFNGKGISRKSFPQIFRAFRLFLDQHPDAMLYLHTEVTGLPGLSDGLHLGWLLEQFQIPLESVTMTNQLEMRKGIEPRLLAELYSAFDVLLNPSFGEGFGIPIVEAQACGTPVITTAWTSMPELTGAGWIVDGEPWFDTRHGAGGADFMCPSVAGIVAALEAAYEARNDQAMRAAAREFALQYDAELVTETYWKPALEQLGRPREVPPLNRAMRRARKREKVTA